MARAASPCCCGGKGGVTGWPSSVEPRLTRSNGLLEATSGAQIPHDSGPGGHYGDDLKPKADGAPAVSTLAGMVQRTSRGAGASSTDQSLPAVSTTPSMLGSPPWLLTDALHRRWYPARRAATEGSTLYQAAWEQILPELANPWNGSLFQTRPAVGSSRP